LANLSVLLFVTVNIKRKFLISRAEFEKIAKILQFSAFQPWISGEKAYD